MIERVCPPPSPREFEARYLKPRRPVIIQGAIDHWPARQWTPEGLAARFGDREVTVEEGSPEATRMTLGQYVDLIRGPPAGIRPYLRGVMLVEVLPELLEEFEILPYFQPNWFVRRAVAPFLGTTLKCWTDLFIGPPKAGFPNLHYDTYMTHNWFTQIYGVKHFYTFPLWQKPFLYTHPKFLSDSLIDELPPDPERFPLFKYAKPIEFDLHPGELLFIPAGLWHTTRMKSVSISLSGNFVNATNFEDLGREIEAHEASPFTFLKRRSFRRWMSLANRVADRLEGPPGRPFKYRAPDSSD